MPAPLFRERSLTVLVIIEAIELFVVAPLSSMAGAPLLLVATIVAANLAAVLAIVWHMRAAVIAVLIAAAMELASVTLRIGRTSERLEVLDFAAGLTLMFALTVVIGIAVFGPGRVTIHRILGAIAIYLNVAATFALAYRMIDALVPGAFSSGLAGVTSGHTLGQLVYFSLATLTTSAYGDIVPVAPFARAFANLESVLGQLFPATLLARLITLELEHRRSER